MKIEDTELKDNVINNKNAAPHESGKNGMIATLRNINFDFLLTGSLMTSGVQWIQTVLINWLVYDITGSGTILGTINLVSTLTSTVIILTFGMIIDYYNRRKLLLVETCVIFIAALAFGLILFNGNRLIIFVIIYSFIYGMTSSFDSTTRQVLIFDLVPRKNTPNAIALIQTLWSIMRVAGPTVGGFLLIWLGIGRSFFLIAGILLLTFITIILMRVPSNQPPAVRQNPLENIREGLTFVLNNRVTRTFCILQVFLSLLIIPIYQILPPIYAAKIFNDESGARHVLAYLLAAAGAGGVIGGIAANFLKRWEYWGRLQIISMVGCGLCLLAFAFSSSYPLALGMLVLSGMFEAVFLVSNATLIQLTIPDKIRGRVTSSLNLVYIATPIGGLIAGAGSDWLGPKGITIVISTVLIAALIFTYFSASTIRNYRLSQAKDSSHPGTT